MGVLVAVWVSNLKIGVVFQSLTLVNSIVLLICRVADIKLDQKTSTLQSSRVSLDRKVKINSHQSPFRHI